MVLLSGVLAWGSLVGGCGGDDGAGTACSAAVDCYPDVVDDLQGGPALCLDRTAGGYCTHECATDADCCAVDGECPAGMAQVCAPFESTGNRMCFLSCEATDVADAGYDDADAYCNDLAARDFGCRSTGGGSQNRKVCFPPG